MRKFLVLALFIIALPCKAQLWGNNDGPDFYIANIINDASYATGVICFPSLKTCSGYLLTPSPCEVDKTYPMMINSPIGAYLLTTTCIGIGDKKVHLIDQFDSVNAAFRSGGEIGFAIPLQSGKFNVVRFSTQGASAAIDRASAAAFTPKPSRAPSGSVQTL